MSGFGDATILLLRTLCHFVLTLIPGIAFAGLAAWRGIRDRFWFGAATLAGIALPSYAAFWLWFLSPRIGHAFSFLLPLLGIGCIYWVMRKLHGRSQFMLMDLLTPVALILAISLLVLSAGFLYGGLDKPLATPWQRFSHPLPPDNILPYLLAEEARIGQIQKHFFENGHSSDRPPLQAAITLAQYPFNPQPRELGYTVSGVILQSFWIFALWLLLSAFDLPPRLVGLAAIATAFSGFIFVNSFFVWPKLLAAAYMTLAAAIVLVDRLFVELKHNGLAAVTTGSLLAFGMLSHPGSAFALIGALLTAVALKRRLSMKPLAIILASAFLLYLPWFLYQKLFDPPGDYLLKLHLAGVEHPDDRPLLETIRTAYGRISFHDFVQSKEANFVWVFDYQGEYWRDVRQMVHAWLLRDAEPATLEANRIRMLSFFHFFSNLGLLGAGAVAFAAGLLRKPRSQIWIASVRLWLYVICTVLPWCVIMFKAESTSIHQGTYTAVLLAFAACTLALWAVAPRLCMTIVALQIIMNFLVYGVYRQTSTIAGASRASLVHGELVLFVIALAFMIVAIRPVWRQTSWVSYSIARE